MKKSSAKPAQLVAANSENIAPRWRSMASAPRDGREILVRVDRCNWIAMFDKDHWWIDADFGQCEEGEMDAWATIPEWTGEVAE